MVHRKIIDPVLKNLGPSRADYFNRLVDRVERDPRTETVPNRVIHDRRFIEDPGRLAEVTKEFVLQVLALAMDQHQVNEIQAAKVLQAKTYRF